MAVPIIAAGAIGSTAIVLLAVAIIIHLLSKEELGLMTIVFGVIAYFWITSRPTG